jgi:uncharacterized SAM-dependent methyltransferase
MPRVGFFPGSTLGNLAPLDAENFLHRARDLLSEGSLFIVGVDLCKDAQVLEAAYDDAQRLTAAFNLNLLSRINRALEGSFFLETFRHRVVWDTRQSRVEPPTCAGLAAVILLELTVDHVVVVHN